MVCRHQHPADDTDGSHYAAVERGRREYETIVKTVCSSGCGPALHGPDLPARAAAPLVRDECGVFDADTLADLEEQAESASDGHDVDVYFLVVDDIGDADQRVYAKNYYISNGLGYGDEQSGILFLLAVGSRKYVTITYGEGARLSPTTASSSRRMRSSGALR